MANLNYVGSLAQERMRILSTTEVNVNTSVDIFNAVSIYVPSKFAKDNLVDWQDAYLQDNGITVIGADLTNYTKVIKGDLLAQWQPAFRQETNFELTMYIIVFDDSQDGNWEITNRGISYAPLTKAFNALYSFSYWKFLFDPTYSGGTEEVIPQTKRFANLTLEFAYKPEEFTVPAGDLTLSDTANNGYSVTIPSGYTVPADGNLSTVLTVTSTVIGSVAGIVEGDVEDTQAMFPSLDIPANVTAVVSGITVPNDGTTSNTFSLQFKQETNMVLPKGNYALQVASSKNYVFLNEVDTPMSISGTTKTVDAFASIEGVETAITGTETFTSTNFNAKLPAGFVATVKELKNAEANPTPIIIKSKYFDFSLALALLCKSNIQLSWFWSYIKISYNNIEKKPNETDACWVRYASRAEQIKNAEDFKTVQRDKYYWGCLYKAGCENTSVIVHSENDFIIGDIIGAYFAQKNSSGTYIGNKLSMLRLSGTRIKPLGWGSWLDESINENDADGHKQLREMNIGFLQTIADDTPQECILSMLRGVGDIDKGTPLSMQNIAKFVDYTCSMEIAKFVSAKGTLTNPVMTDEAAYKKIQGIIANTLMRFSGTNGRITGVTMQFPAFNVAKVSKNALSVASAWKAWYQDDLDSVTVSGGIVAE